MKNLLGQIKFIWIIVGFISVNLVVCILSLLSANSRFIYSNELGSLSKLIIYSWLVCYLITLLISAGMMFFGIAGVISALIKRTTNDRAKGLFIKGLILLIIIFVTFFC